MSAEEQRQPNTRSHELTEKFMMTMKLHRMYLERELNHSGVYRSQQQILMYIARCPNASQREIAERQHVSTATIAVSLKKLEKGGYISRSADKQDNRFNQICITPRGQEIVDKSRSIFSRAEEAQFRGFTSEELTQMDDFLNRIRLNLEYLLQESPAPEKTESAGAEAGAPEMPECAKAEKTAPETPWISPASSQQSGGDT